MDDIGLASSPSVIKPSCSPINNNRQRTDSASVIQQADVSSSRPALLAYDALGPLLFEALDGFFFTINHNSELDFVSDNVGQYLKFSQEELAGRNLYHFVHPSDVGEFSKAWAKKDAGDSLAALVNNEQSTIQSRGRTFTCRMRTNDDSTPYVRMIISVALHRESLGGDKTFLICIARRPPLNDPNDKPSLLGFDQFSSRVNLNYEIENLDSSHMKSERLDMDFHGKNFRDYIYLHDIPLIERHFQEVIEKGEGKSSVYRFCLHDNIYAFINTRSKLFHNSTTKSDSILSTHTIVRLIENINDLNGNASTRLMKSIISSNRDLQRNKQNSQQQIANKPVAQSPVTPPIGTQFALTMFGMHKNASNSLQQHVSSTLGTLVQVQNSLSTNNVNEKTPSQQQNPLTPSPSPIQNRVVAQKPSPLEIHSSQGNVPSPINSFDLFFNSPTPANTNSNDLNQFLASPTNNKLPSPLFSNNDIYTTSSSPRPPLTSPSPSLQNSARSSIRLRQLLTNKSPTANENPSQIVHYHADSKLDEFIQGPESPTTTHVSPLTNELLSANSLSKRQLKASPSLHEHTNGGDGLLKRILERPNSHSTSPLRPESNHSDDSSSSGHASTKQRSDTYLRTLLNDEVRPQKVIVDTPFAIGARQLSQQVSSNNTNVLGENNKTKANSTRLTLKSQLSDASDGKGKKKQRQNSCNFANQNNPMPRKPGRPKRNQTDYLLTTTNCQTPPSTLSDGSLDALLDSSTNIDQPTAQTSPIVLRRTTRQTSTSNMNMKRSSENDEQLSSARKIPKLLAHGLKVESQDFSPTATMPNTKLFNQTSQPTIKTEPELYEHSLPFDKNLPLTQHQMNRPLLANGPSSQSKLRELIRTPQTSPLITKKDAPLYDLLEHLETNTAGTISNDNVLFSGQGSLNNSVDPFEQYLTPVLSQTPIANNTNANNNPTKDYYLAALLNTDPGKPNEISFTSSTKQQTQNDNNRITAIAHELFNSTAMTNNSNDDFLSLLESKDFLECLSDSTAIDTILSQNSTSLIEQTFPTSSTKRSEKDEKAISEIYKTLVTSFNPGSSQQSSSTIDPLSMDTNTSNPISGDFLFSDNPNSIPPNRTVNHDPLASMYGQPSVPPSSTFPYTNNNNQYPDCLSMDLLDNGGSFPPNVTLSPMNNSYQTQITTTNTTLINSNSMMMYSQQNDPHIQHRPTQSMVYRHPPPPPPPPQQPQLPPQQPMYNNYVQPPQSQPPPPPNTMPSGYYSMPPTANQPLRMTPSNHHQASLVKRQPMLQQSQPTPQQQSQQQQQQQRSVSQMNQHQQQQQQVQLHMSMNVTLPHMMSNHHQQQQQHHQQQSQQQPPPQQQQPLAHRPMMNAYNEPMMANNNIPQMQQDYHQYPNNNSLDLSYNPDLFMPQSSNIGQQPMPNRHMNVMQHQQPPPSHPPSHSQHPMHQQPYSNMSVALSATIQQNSHNSNNLMNQAMPNLTPAECRQSEELNNQMMNCLSFQPVRSTSEFVRKQLQNTIQGRQKPTSGKDIPVSTGHNSLSANLDCNQKGAFFRNQLASSMSTPPLQTTVRPQPQDKPL